jgi:hypothetical protein
MPEERIDEQEREDVLIGIHQFLTTLEETDSESVIRADIRTTDNAVYEEGLGDTRELIEEPTEETISITITRRVGRDYIYHRLHELSSYIQQLRTELRKAEEHKRTLEGGLSEEN